MFNRSFDARRHAASGCTTNTEIDYHLRRARTERDLGYRTANALAADAHMRLSALHLQRALMLRTVQRVPVGNVEPFPLNDRRTQAIGRN